MMPPIKLMCAALALVLATSSLAESFLVSDCPGAATTGAKVISFQIDSCPDQTADRCLMYIGKNITLSGELEPTRVFEQANVRISAKLGSSMVPIYFPGPMDACGNYGMHCPTVVGQRQRFKFSKNLNRLIFPIKTTAQLELLDQNSGRILCKQIPVKLKWA